LSAWKNRWHIFAEPYLADQLDSCTNGPYTGRMILHCVRYKSKPLDIGTIQMSNLNKTEQKFRTFNL